MVIINNFNIHSPVNLFIFINNKVFHYIEKNEKINLNWTYNIQAKQADRISQINAPQIRNYGLTPGLKFFK